MIKEAEGRAMQKAFNKTLQLDPNANPFSNFRMYVDGGEYMYDEKKVHDMWEDGLRIITQPVGPNLNQNMLNSLFGSNKKVNENKSRKIFLLLCNDDRPVTDLCLWPGRCHFHRKVSRYSDSQSNGLLFPPVFSAPIPVSR